MSDNAGRSDSVPEISVRHQNPVADESEADRLQDALTGVLQTVPGNLRDIENELNSDGFHSHQKCQQLIEGIQASQCSLVSLQKRYEEVTGQQIDVKTGFEINQLELSSRRLVEKISKMLNIESEQTQVGAPNFTRLLAAYQNSQSDNIPPITNPNLTYYNPNANIKASPNLDMEQLQHELVQHPISEYSVPPESEAPVGASYPHDQLFQGGSSAYGRNLMAAPSNEVSVKNKSNKGDSQANGSVSSIRAKLQAKVALNTVERNYAVKQTARELRLVNRNARRAQEDAEERAQERDEQLQKKREGLEAQLKAFENVDNESQVVSGLHKLSSKVKTRAYISSISNAEVSDNYGGGGSNTNLKTRVYRKTPIEIPPEPVISRHRSENTKLKTNMVVPDNRSEIAKIKVNTVVPGNRPERARTDLRPVVSNYRPKITRTEAWLVAPEYHPEIVRVETGLVASDHHPEISKTERRQVIPDCRTETVETKMKLSFISSIGDESPKGLLPRPNISDYLPRRKHQPVNYSDSLNERSNRTPSNYIHEDAPRTVVPIRSEAPIKPRLEAPRHRRSVNNRNTMEDFTGSVYKDVASVPSIHFPPERGQVFPPHQSNLEGNNNSSDRVIRAVCEQMSLSRLPIMEPQVFTGQDPLQFPVWKASFDALVHYKAITDAERLHFLSRYVGGEAKRAIQGFFHAIIRCLPEILPSAS